MSRLLTQDEVEALLASGPVVSAPVERPRIVIGESVDIVAEGAVVAHGQVVSVDGRTCVRILSLAKPGPTPERSTR